MPNYPYDDLGTPLDATNLERLNNNYDQIQADIQSADSASQQRDAAISTDYNTKLNVQQSEYTGRLDAQRTEYTSALDAQKDEYTGRLNAQNVDYNQKISISKLDYDTKFVAQSGRIDNIVSEISTDVFEQVVEDNKITPQTPVANYATLLTTYPNPENGWEVQTLDDGKIYRRVNEAWLYVQELTPGPVSLLTGKVEDESPFLNNGKLMLPDSFPTLPFNVFKNKYGEYYSDATPYNQFDWSTAVNVYISCSGSGTDGLNFRAPITLAVFRNNFNSGTYGSNKKFVLNMMNNIYWLNSSASNAFILDIDADLLFKASNPSSFTWLGRFKSSLINTYASAWVLDSGVYKTTQTTSHDILDVMNVNVLNDFKMPSIYTKKTTLAECQALPGSFYRSGFDVWVNPFVGDKVDDLLLVVSSAVMTINSTFARTTMFENIGFAPSSYQTGIIENAAAKMYMFNCKFHRAVNNGYYLTGKYSAYNFNCVVSHPTLDCYNYHATDVATTAVEVNCIGYGAGKAKLSTGQPTHSNNGSTAHDGMNMLRVGSRYSDCEGPIVADVNNCFSISIGTEASGILSTATGNKSAFFMEDNVGDTDLTSKPKYILESKGYGKNVATGVTGTNKTFIANFDGLKSYVGPVKGRGDIVW